MFLTVVSSGLKEGGEGGGGKGPDNIRISTSPILANPQPQADEDHWIFNLLT